jgi:transcriptional regulator with XRE-family HTH domain
VVAIGENIQQWRMKRGLSVKDVEKRAQMAPSVLEHVESGALDPTASTLSAIADVFGIPVPWLYSSPEQLDSLLQQGELTEDDLRGSVDPVTDRILRAKRGSRDLFHLLASLIEHGDPKLLRAAEVNLNSLVKETRRPPIPWASRQPGNFDPPND